MPNALAPTNNALNEPSAAFGFFPQLRRTRTQQDPEAAKDMPVQFGMGRGAATLGMPADIANIFRSPAQTEMFGETNYDAPAQFNWTTQHFQNIRPLQPTSPAGAAASNLGALAPLSPAEALQAARLARIAAVEAGRGGKAVLNMAGEELANRMLSGRSTIPGVPSAFAPSPLKFASEPGGPRQELTNQMRELLAQRKLLQAGPEMNALNLELSSLQQQFKEMPAVQRVAKEVVAPQVTAPVSNIGFYSAAEQASLNLARQSGTGEAFLNDLMKVPDVKKEELAWTGLDDFLRGKPNVTKKEVQDFIAANKVDVQEVRLGEAVVEDPVGMAKRKEIFDKYEPEIQAMYKEMDNPSYKLVYRPITEEEKGVATVLQMKEYRGEELTAQEAAELESIKVKFFGTPVKDFANEAEALKYYSGMSQEDKLKHSIMPKFGATELQNKINRVSATRDEAANAVYVVPETKPTKHSSWQLPGGENYREILLTLPKQWEKPRATQTANEARIQALRQEMHGTSGTDEIRSEISKLRVENAALQQQINDAPIYKSSHFNEPNILAHMRVNDRIDAEGKKMLLIEEVQSDWHQAGRKGSYTDPSKRFEVFDPKDGKPIAKFATIDEAKEFAKKSGPEFDYGKSEGVPDAPFKDTWHQVALKRALKYAADNGYERVGLTTGKQQIDRYSNQLRQNVSEINFQTGQKLTTGETAELQAYRQQKTPMTGSERRRYEYLSDNEGEYVGKGQTKIRAYNGSRSTFTGTVADGKFIDGPGVGKTVEEVLGKTMAKQIAEQKTGNIRGDDLTIGGEGMKAYYDEIYPAFLDKQSKKWNAKTGETKIKTKTNASAYVDYIVGEGNFNNTTVLGVRSDGSRVIVNQNANSLQEAQQLANQYKEKHLGGRQETIRYIDITPEMKGALAQGQPLHGLIPAIPAAGFGVEGMNRQQNSLAPPTSNALFLSGAGL